MYDVGNVIMFEELKMTYSLLDPFPKYLSFWDWWPTMVICFLSLSKISNHRFCMSDYLSEPKRSQTLCYSISRTLQPTSCCHSCITWLCHNCWYKCSSRSCCTAQMATKHTRWPWDAISFPTWKGQRELHWWSVHANVQRTNCIWFRGVAISPSSCICSVWN